MKQIVRLVVLVAVAFALSACSSGPPKYEPAFSLKVGGDMTAPLTVEFHTASGMAITRPAAEAMTGEGDVNLGVPGGLSGSQATDLIRSGLPSGL